MNNKHVCGAWTLPCQLQRSFSCLTDNGLHAFCFVVSTVCKTILTLFQTNMHFDRMICSQIIGAYLTYVYFEVIETCCKNNLKFLFQINRNQSKRTTFFDVKVEIPPTSHVKIFLPRCLILSCWEFCFVIPQMIKH